MRLPHALGVKTFFYHIELADISHPALHNHNNLSL